VALIGREERRERVRGKEGGEGGWQESNMPDLQRYF
jgi:hypothetical protein